MCGGAIVAGIVAPASRSSWPLTADLLEGEAAADLNKKRNRGGNYSKPLRSASIIDVDDEFEAEFQDFKDHSDDEDEISLRKPFAASIIDVDNEFEAEFQDFKDHSDDEDEIGLRKPFAFSSSKKSGFKGLKSVDSAESDEDAEKSSKRKRKNQYIGIQQRPWGIWRSRL